MNLITAENRDLTDLDINQPKEPHEPRSKDPHIGDCYLALTFGTLLSSQGADAHGTGPLRVVVRGLCCPARHPGRGLAVGPGAERKLRGWEQGVKPGSR